MQGRRKSTSMRNTRRIRSGNSGALENNGAGHVKDGAGAGSAASRIRKNRVAGAGAEHPKARDTGAGAEHPKARDTGAGAEHPKARDTGAGNGNQDPESMENGGAGPENRGNLGLLSKRKSTRIVKATARELLKDEDVRRWHENLRRGSISTADGMLRRLNLFCHRIGKTPSEYASLAKEDSKKAEDVLLDHIKWMEECKYGPGYMDSVVKTAKSWLRYHRINSIIKIRFKGSNTPTTLADEQNPTPAHIGKMLAAANPRGRAVISMMAFAGLRPQVMGNADGSDGLTLGDFPELVIDGRNTHFEKVPAQVVVRSSISKANTKYVTFLSRTGCNMVLGYLMERIAQNEELGPGSPLIRATKGWDTRRKLECRKSPFVRTTTVTDAVFKPVKAVMKIRVYALRSYFDTQLLLAESNGYMTHAYRQFFMGHKGDMEARYTTNKGRLTEQMLEDMRRCYKNSQYFLYPDDEDGKKGKKRVLFDLWKQQAKIHGIDISGMLNDPDGDGSAAGEDPDEGPEEAGGAGPPPGAGNGAAGRANNGGAGPPAGARKGPVNKVANGDDELVDALNEGWTLFKELSNDKYIMHWEGGA